MIQFALDNIGKIILALTLVTCAVLIFKYYSKIKTFLIETKTELGKVAWSNRQELIGSTFVIIVITAIMALFIFIIDFSLSRVLTLILK